MGFIKKAFCLKIIAFMCLGFSCASTQKTTQIKVEFKKIDHFFVGDWEVGALEYEPVIRAEGSILRYQFPVYKEGKRVRDFYVYVYGNPNEFALFKGQKVSPSFLENSNLLWLLEEKTDKEPHLIIKKFEKVPTYQQIKSDLSLLLSR